MSDDTPIIQLSHVNKSYDGVRNAVEDFNLTVRKGEFITFLGPSGCGKTTTLRMIGGFEYPTSGQILLNGKDLTKLPPNKRPINTVFQRYALFPHMSIAENIAFGLKLRKGTDRLSRKQIAEKVAHVLDVVDLPGMEDRMTSTLSGGQQQRVAIARAIVNEPEILLLDEPLGALDLKMRQEMQLELKNMHRELGITFIYVTHDQEEAITMSDRIVVMNDGRIQQTGTAEDIYNEPASVFVADFIGESNILPGIMTGDRQVRFLGHDFPCLDDYPADTPADVIVRPEDVILSPAGENYKDLSRQGDKKTADDFQGPVTGQVISCIFKGIFYEITLQIGSSELVAKSTRAAETGSFMRAEIEPDGIHVIPAGTGRNRFSGVITKNHTLAFAGGECIYDVTRLYKGSVHDNSGHLFGADGERIHLTDVPVEVDIPIDALSMSDEIDDAPMTGEIISLYYVGDHYRYIVRTSTGEDFTIKDEYLWNVHDTVAVNIDSDKMNVKLAEKGE